MSNIELEYTSILSELLEKTNTYSDDRTGIGTTRLFSRTLRHDMSDGFPLFTTKRMAKKAMAVELEGFIKGISSKSWYKDRGCNIWNDWCAPIAQKLNPGTPPEEIDDLGSCMYGASWRGFHDPNGVDNNHVDQLANIVNTLKTDPSDRRMVCVAWNPLAFEYQALPPCHYSWQVTVIDGKLNLTWTQRSADWFLGVPFNVASYALLLHLLAKDVNLEVGELVGHFVDVHLYKNHRKQAREQLERLPYDLCYVRTIPAFGEFDIFNWKHTDSEFVRYECHETIKAPVAV